MPSATMIVTTATKLVRLRTTIDVVPILGFLAATITNTPRAPVIMEGTVQNGMPNSIAILASSFGDKKTRQKSQRPHEESEK